MTWRAGTNEVNQGSEHGEIGFLKEEGFSESCGLKARPEVLPVWFRQSRQSRQLWGGREGPC